MATFGPVERAELATWDATVSGLSSVTGTLRRGNQVIPASTFPALTLSEDPLRLNAGRMTSTPWASGVLTALFFLVGMASAWGLWTEYRERTNRPS